MGDPNTFVIANAAYLLFVFRVEQRPTLAPLQVPLDKPCSPGAEEDASRLSLTFDSNCPLVLVHVFDVNMGKFSDSAASGI
jgi:hypothetical protein